MFSPREECSKLTCFPFLYFKLFACIVSNKKYVVFTSLYLKNGPFFLWLLTWYARCRFSTPHPMVLLWLWSLSFLDLWVYSFHSLWKTFAHYFSKYFFLCAPPLLQIRSSKFECVRLLRVIPQLTFSLCFLDSFHRYAFEVTDLFLCNV